MRREVEAHLRQPQRAAYWAGVRRESLAGVYDTLPEIREATSCDAPIPPQNQSTPLTGSTTAVAVVIGIVCIKVLSFATVANCM